MSSRSLNLQSRANIFFSRIRGAFILALSIVIISGSARAALINEIRIDRTGGGSDDFFELAGTPGEDLSNASYIVLTNDTVSTGGIGVIQTAIALTSETIGADGFWLAITEGARGNRCDGLPREPDLVTFINFPSQSEEKPNSVHMLVRGFTGHLGDDLDPDDDGYLDSAPWSNVDDSISLVSKPSFATHYTTPTLNVTDNYYSPSHVYRYPDKSPNWIEDPDGPVMTYRDTPGYANVPNYDRPATSVMITTDVIYENSGRYEYIGNLFTNDPDCGSRWVFAITSDPLGNFYIPRYSSALYSDNGAKLNHEANPFVDLGIQASDEMNGISIDATIRIYIEDAAEPPVDILLSNSSVAENSANGTFIGRFTTVDPDVETTPVFTYLLVNNADGRFEIVGDELRVANGSLLDYEAATQHSIVVRSTDSTGLQFQKTFIIEVTDVLDTTPTPSPSLTPTDSPTPSPSETPTPSPSESPTSTPTLTLTPSLSPSETPTPSPSESPTSTPTLTLTPSLSPSETPSPSPSESPTSTPTLTLTPSLTESPTPLPSETPSPTVTETPLPTITDTPLASPSDSPAPTDTPAPSETETLTPTPAETIEPTASESPTPSASLSPSPSPPPQIFYIY